MNGKQQAIVIFLVRINIIAMEEYYFII